MRHEDNRGASLEQILNRRQSRADARVVCYLLIFTQRHVKIDAHECALTRNVDIAQRFLCHVILTEKHASQVVKFLIYDFEFIDRF